jgi:Tol biopolymer transport system component/predicted Ser/Thr protein kinase
MSSLAPGERLGPYEILSLLGEGGMGQVWKARDTRLDRIVAIKTSQAKFSERFDREARAVAALNHPHICQLYDVGPDYLVMEYVEGKPLAGPLPLAQALQYAVQICDALDAAHSKGIVHRDLKPGNILVGKSGVKVLDFGLAKMERKTEPEQATVTMPLTGAGTVLGTLQYMSPEQLEGQEADARSDIFALGIVLYEMIGGKRPFAGKSQASLIAAILKEPPRPLPELQPLTPVALNRVVETCLEKDPEKRWQSARDVANALALVSETGPPAASAAPAPSRRGWVAWAVAGLMASALALLAFVHFREARPEPRVITSTLLPPEDARQLNMPALSPDGRTLVVAGLGTGGQTRLWVRPLDSAIAKPLAGTEGAIFPFWSPDSRSIGFYQNGKLMRMAADGGPAVALADNAFPGGASWSARGVIVFSTGSGLQRVPAGGGASAAVTTVGSNDYVHCYPWFLPDGRHFLFADQTRSGGRDYQLRIGALDSREVQTIGAVESQVMYANGYLLYKRGNTLVAQPFDEKRLATTGEAQPVAPQLPFATDANIWGPWAEVSVSSGGLLAYTVGSSALDTHNLQLTWYERGGKRVQTLPGPGDMAWIEFSPDRKSLAGGRSGNDLWIYDMARGLPTRFTFNGALTISPVWSPDGRSIAYSSSVKGLTGIYRKAADGTGTDQLLYEEAAPSIVTTWSPDGKFLLFDRIKKDNDIWVLPLGPGAGKPYPWIATPFVEFNARFSPDGRWVAYQSSESGHMEIYAAPFPGPGGKRQISIAGGNTPRWRSNGKEIFYVRPDGMLMAAEVSEKGAGLDVGAVRSLNIPVVRITRIYTYDVSTDGQRILALTEPEHATAAPLTLVQNWPALLKK